MIFSLDQPTQFIKQGWSRQKLASISSETGRIISVNEGADQMAPEIEAVLYLKYEKKGDEINNDITSLINQCVHQSET